MTYHNNVNRSFFTTHYSTIVEYDRVKEGQNPCQNDYTRYVNNAGCTPESYHE
jgi:hypothetical protein